MLLQLELLSKLQSDSRDTMDRDSKRLISFYAEKTHRISDGCGADDLKMN